MQAIKSVHIKKDATIIGFVESYQPHDSTRVANEKTPGKESDMPRHADFEHALQRLKYHLIIANEMAAAVDGNGNALQSVHFNDLMLDEDNEPKVFQGLELTAMIIQGKNANDGVQLIGTKTLTSGEVIKLKTPSIALEPEIEGYTYPLREILAAQVAKALNEANLYHTRKKHGAGMQTRAEFPDGPPSQPTGDQIDQVIDDRKAGKSTGVKKSESKKHLALAEAGE